MDLPFIIPFDPTVFRKTFPPFASLTKYPDEQLQFQWDMATCYISDRNYGRLNNKCRLLALNLMTAHLMYLQMKLATAGTGGKVRPSMGGVVTSATIDKVSVSLLPPPVTNPWDFWLAQSPYGQQLLALLDSASVGGFTAGGLPEGDAFRKVYGQYRSPGQLGM